MRNIITIIFLFIITIANAQNITIPDENFKDYLLDNTSINTVDDGEISVAEAIAFTGTINCKGNSIADLTGIEEFINITGLTCDINNLTSLDVSSNINITRLECDSNRGLSLLNLGNNENITFLNCTLCDLETLDLSTVPNLEDLDCQNNSISSLDFANNSKLEDINVAFNELTVLDVSNNLALRNIGCENNMIENIDVSINENVSSIDCENNNLKSLNISNGGTQFFNLLRANGNSELTCIQVDKLSDVRETTWDFDETVSFSIDCMFTLGLNDVLLEEAIKIYRKTGSDFISIESEKEIELLKIYSINGSLMKTVESPSEINVSNWSEGIYLFIIQAENDFLTKKMFIK